MSGRDSFVDDVVVVTLHEEGEIVQLVFLLFEVTAVGVVVVVAENLLFVLKPNSSGLDEGWLERVPVAVEALLTEVVGQPDEEEDDQQELKKLKKNFI